MVINTDDGGDMEILLLIFLFCVFTFGFLRNILFNVFGILLWEFVLKNNVRKNDMVKSPTSCLISYREAIIA